MLRSATTKSEYDLAGNLTATVDALNRRTTYVYNSMNLLTSVQQPHPDSASSAAGPLWQRGLVESPWASSGPPMVGASR